MLGAKQYRKGRSNHVYNQSSIHHASCFPVLQQSRVNKCGSKQATITKNLKPTVLDLGKAGYSNLIVVKEGAEAGDKDAHYGKI